MDSANAASAGSPTNKGSLLVRVTSALILLPLLILLVWWGVLSVAFTVAVASVICLLELYSAFTAGGFRPRVGVGITVGVALVAAVTVQPMVALDLPPLVLAGAIIFSLISELFRSEQDPTTLPSWALTFTGAIYISWLLSHFVLLRSITVPLNPSPLSFLRIEPGTAWVFLVFAVTFLQDTFAYFVGRSFGRHKLAPILSPKKTWEGAIGGMTGAIVASLLSVFLMGLPISYGSAILIGIIGGIVGPLGDLSESLIKRMVGVKDIGKIIPGHGGMLDRADSLLFTAPILYYVALLLLQ